MVVQVIVNITHEAIHSWPGCPYDEVDFLRHPHRHVFHIRAKKPVKHTDRDVEIIMLKRAIEKYLADHWGRYWAQSSCEMVAQDLAETFDLSYCSVLEDGENGAEVAIS